MHWIYILKCINGERGRSYVNSGIMSEQPAIYYVGETTRLYRRFWEHADGMGGVNTAHYVPEYVACIYNIQHIRWFINFEKNVCNTIANYYRYAEWSIENFGIEDCIRDTEVSHLYAENYIAECLMQKHEVRGGKYTRLNIKPNLTNINISLPLCKCDLPCDIQKVDDTIYFRCPKKNIWDEMRRNVNVTEDPPCKYYQSYDMHLKLKTLAQQLREKVKQSPWLWIIPYDQYTYCLGGCGKEYDRDNCVRGNINLCYSCFIDTGIHKKLTCQYDTKPDINSCLL